MRRVRLGVLTALCAVALAACGSGDGGGTSPGTSAGTQSEKPRSGGTLTIGGLETPTLDPSTVFIYQNSFFFDPLMKRDKSGVLQPFLAESFKHAADSSTWTLKLRSGVKFHDGTPLNSDAVLVNLDRYSDKKSTGHAVMSKVDSYRKVDDLTVEFKLKSPDALFSNGFALTGPAFILSAAAIEKYGDKIGQHPIGTGPFILQENVPGDRMVMTKNPNYWQEGKPYLDKVIWKPIADEDTRAQAVVSGQIDIAWADSDRVLDPARKAGLTVVGKPGQPTVGLGLNQLFPPFDDVRMRKAVAMAIDYDAIDKVVFGGDMTRAYGPIGTNDPYYLKEMPKLMPGHDVAAAKKLVDEYRAEGKNPDFTITIPGTTRPKQVSQLVQDFMKSVGVKVEVKSIEYSQYVTEFVTCKVQMSVASGRDFDDLSQVFSDQLKPGGAFSFYYCGNNNPEMTKLLDKSRENADPKFQADIWEEFQRLFAKSVPGVWFASTASAQVTQKYVHGVELISNGNIQPENIWLDK